MTSTSSREASPAPSSSPPANLQVQTDTSTQTDDENMESADSSFQRSSAPSPSPTLSSLLRPNVPLDLVPSPSIYSPRPEPLPNWAGATRSSSPISVEPTRPGSPVRLVDEDKPLIPEAPSSPVLAHSVPVPVPVGARVTVPDVNADVDQGADPDADPDQSSNSTTTTTSTTTLTPPTAATTATTADRTPEKEDPVGSIPCSIRSGVASSQPQMHPDTEIDTHIDTRTYILNPNIPNPIPSFSNNTTNIRFLHQCRHYGHYPSYGHDFFFPDNDNQEDLDLRGYTLTALTAPTHIPIAPMSGEYYPPYGHGIWVPEEGAISVSVGRWEYRHTSRLAVVRSEDVSSSREPEDDEPRGAETPLVTDGEGVEGVEGVEGERRNSHFFQGPYGRGY